MKNFIKKYWLLIAILILASSLRFWKLDSYPALNADEAAIGYNAYSLIKTGLDEHGHAWPIHFQSFNDYKPGLYFYIVLPFVKFLGLNEWAVRIPGAAFGVLSVLVIYFLVKKLFKEEKFAIISALFLAISPWHIQFSRGGWEVNTATFFILAGLLSFVSALNLENFKQKIFKLSLSSIFLVASLYTYHAARVVVPLLGISILIIYKKEIFKNFKPYLIFAAMSLIILLPLGRDLLSPGALSRVAGVGLFADPGPLNRINEQRGEHENLNNLAGKLIHNKVVNYGLAFSENWASHFHGEFLFLTGDAIQRNKVPETGEMYLFDIVFLAVGVISVFKVLGDRDEKSKNWILIICWLLISPVASALTFQAPNALRAQNMVIPLIIISAYGFLKVIEWLRLKNLRFGIWLLVILIIWLFARYEHMYWVHMSKEYPFSSQYGVKELVSYVVANDSKYKNVVVTTRYDQPYILLLFYTKYTPKDFQNNHILTSKDQFGFSTVPYFDKFHFQPIDFQSVKNNFPNSLIIGTPDEIPKEANIVKRIYGSNGYEYFDVVAN